MSQVSRWPGEPTRIMVMQFLTLAVPSAAPAAWSRSRFGRVRVASPAAPAVRKLRRVTPEQTGTLTVPTFSIGRLLAGACEASGSDRVTHRVRHVDELAVRELAVGALL